MRAAMKQPVVAVTGVAAEKMHCIYVCVQRIPMTTEPSWERESPQEEPRREK